VALTGLKHGGEFNLLEATLILSTGQPINLIPGRSITGLTLFENIDSHVVTGTLTIQDAINLGSSGPIIGQEYLRLKIATPGLDSDQDHNIDFTDNAFMVTSLNERVDIGDGVQSMTLNFSSRELIVNHRQRVNRALSGTYSKIVETMLRTDLDSNKNLYIETSIDNKKLIAPNIYPFDVIHIATKHAISKRHNDPTFIFWESMRGFNFRTLGNMYSKEPIIKYEYSIPGTRYSDGRLDMKAEISSIENWKITGTPDLARHYRSGTYSSDLIVHDIISKSYQKTTYNYLNNFSEQRHIDKKSARPIVNALSLTPDGKNVSSFPSTQYLKPVVGFDTDESQQDDSYQYAFSSNNLPKSIQSRGSQMSMMNDGLSLNIDVVGTTLVFAGDIVGIKIPNTSAHKQGNDHEDSLFNGNFLVKTIRHDFNIITNKHTMSMHVVKDSTTKNVHSPSDNSEPKQKQRAATFIEGDDIGL